MSGETKISEVAESIQKRLPFSRGSFMRFFDWYHHTYIKANSAKPIVHLMVVAGVIGYAMEYPHLKHEVEERRKAASEI